MVEGTTLRAVQINHGQSEIWLETNGKEATERRKLATNEVVNATRRHCPDEIFQAFYKEYYPAIGRLVALDCPQLDAIAEELRLRN